MRIRRAECLRRVNVLLHEQNMLQAILSIVNSFQVMKQTKGLSTICRICLLSVPIEFRVYGLLQLDLSAQQHCRNQFVDKLIMKIDNKTRKHAIDSIRTFSNGRKAVARRQSFNLCLIYRVMSSKLLLHSNCGNMSLMSRQKTSGSNSYSDCQPQTRSPRAANFFRQE